jgi:hypothetical protein
MIESLARIPVEVDYASEFRYREPIILPDSLHLFITNPEKPPIRSPRSALCAKPRERF